MKIKPFKVAFPDLSEIESPDAYSDAVKFNFRQHFDEGLYRVAPKRGIYIYQIDYQGRRHIGIVALNDVGDFFDGKVKRHENTLSEKEREHLNLILYWQAVLKPVLLTHKEVPEIREWLQQYARRHHAIFTAKFKKGAQLHKVWAVTQPADIDHILALYKKNVNQAYIADGHHRTTTMAQLHERFTEQNPDLDLDHLFCAFFAEDQLDILDYNRVVQALDQLSPLQFMAHLSRVFEITPLPVKRKPQHKHELVLLIRKEWFSLKWKEEILHRFPPDEVLFDASLLNDYVLQEILKIQDVRSDSRIEYVEGSKELRGIEKLCGGGKIKVGFILYPVSFDNMIKVADAGGSLPPKSTYFAPRLKSGVLVQLLNRNTH
ncbi:MAG: DUF1015 family protein [Saprospiraceae bacterium]